MRRFSFVYSAIILVAQVTLFESVVVWNISPFLASSRSVLPSLVSDSLLAHTLPEFFPSHSHFFNEVPSPTIRLRKKEYFREGSQSPNSYSQESFLMH